MGECKSVITKLCLTLTKGVSPASGALCEGEFAPATRYVSTLCLLILTVSGCSRAARVHPKPPPSAHMPGLPAVLMAEVLLQNEKAMQGTLLL